MPRVIPLAIVAVVLATPAVAVADGTLTIRGVYYKERATRVTQPMIDGNFEAGERGTVDAHLLIDAITSASAATGADGVPFTERRVEGGLSYAHQLDRVRLSGQTRYSREPDYVSLFGGVRGEASLAEDNLVLGLGLGVGGDDISNTGARGPFVPEVSGRMTSWLVSASASQVLGPAALVGLNYDAAYLDGFQQNPYRTAITDDGLISERHPRTRLRHGIAISGRRYLANTHTTVIGSYRYYLDDWGVRGHTPEVRVVQAAGDTVEFAARYRYHRQHRADFYADRYGSSDPMDTPFLTDDTKLSSFSAHTLEAKLDVVGEAFGWGGRWEETRGEVVLQYVDQNNEFGNAIIAQVALTVPLSY